eukprot:m51a1_g14727 hypothetical protein (699) ;mRNA; r:216202-218624
MEVGSLAHALFDKAKEVYDSVTRMIEQAGEVPHGLVRLKNNVAGVQRVIESGRMDDLKILPAVQAFLARSTQLIDSLSAALAPAAPARQDESWAAAVLRKVSAGKKRLKELLAAEGTLHSLDNLEKEYNTVLELLQTACLCSLLGRLQVSKYLSAGHVSNPAARRWWLQKFGNHHSVKVTHFVNFIKLEMGAAWRADMDSYVHVCCDTNEDGDVDSAEYAMFTRDLPYSLLPDDESVLIPCPLSEYLISISESFDYWTAPVLTPLDNEVELKVRHAPKTQAAANAPAPANLTKPFYETKRAIVIGINRYSSRSIKELKAAESDALRVASTLRLFGYETTTLTGETATKDTIEHLVSHCHVNCGKKSALVLFFAGHGCLDKNKNSLILCYDSDPKKLDTAIPIAGLQAMAGHHTAIILDCCHSGSFNSSAPQDPRRMPRPKPVVIDQCVGPVVQILSAGKATQISEELSGEVRQHGTFSKQFVRGLEDGDVFIEYGRNWVTFNEFGTWICKQVDLRTDGRMTPQFATLGGTGHFIFHDTRKIVTRTRSIELGTAAPESSVICCSATYITTGPNGASCRPEPGGVIPAGSHVWRQGDKFVSSEQLTDSKGVTWLRTTSGWCKGHAASGEVFCAVASVQPRTYKLSGAAAVYKHPGKEAIQQLPTGAELTELAEFVGKDGNRWVFHANGDKRGWTSVAKAL